MYSSIVEKCGESLSVDLTTEVAIARGIRKRITLYDLILALISTASTDLAAKTLNSSKTYVLGYCKKFLKPYFPNKANNEHWGILLLALTENKYCNTCNTLQHISAFSNRGTTKVSACKECAAVTTLRCTEKNREQYKQTASKYYENNKEQILTRSRKYYSEHREHYRSIGKEYYQEHKADYIASNLKRRLCRSNATPTWASLAEMNKIYLLCPEECHVDHLIPLQGDLVCGLHCEHNLQYLSIAENLFKSNKFDSDDYVHLLQYTEPYL